MGIVIGREKAGKGKGKHIDLGNGEELRGRGRK